MSSLPRHPTESKSPTWPSTDGREPFWCDDESDPTIVPHDPDGDFNPLADAIDAEFERFTAIGTPAALLMAEALAELAFKVRVTDTFFPAEFPDRLAKLDEEIRCQKIAAEPVPGASWKLDRANWKLDRDDDEDEF